jgi:hypothetical protein
MGRHLITEFGSRVQVVSRGAPDTVVAPADNMKFWIQRRGWTVLVCSRRLRPSHVIQHECSEIEETRSGCSYFP